MKSFRIVLSLLIFAAIAQHLDCPVASGQVAIQGLSILKQHCVSCHGEDLAEGGLRLDTREHLLRGGSRGSVVDLDVPRESLLIKTVRQAVPGLEMPPKNPLSSKEVDLLEQWAHQGFPWPKPAQSPKDPLPKLESTRIGDAWTDAENPIRKLFNGQRLDLWSLKPISCPPVPRVNGPHESWPSTAVDSFLLSAWSKSDRDHHRATEESLTLSPEVSLHTWARRVAFDLTGLPPDEERLLDLLTDYRPDAQRRWIDRHLASPEFGEHWGRIWLDVVRYSDSNGFDWDEFRPQAWRFRDYVVRSWNADRPYDEFVRQQLAGDELLSGPPQTAEDQDCLIATGYLRLGPHDNAASLFNEQDRSRAELLADLTETTGSAFLGLTLSCCRCHDHKTEPISQADHYRIRAFFASVKFADDLPLDLAPVQVEIQKERSVIDEQIKQIDAQSPEGKAKIKQLKLQQPSFTYGLLMTDEEGPAPPTHILYQGDHRSPGEIVLPGFLSVLDPNDCRLVGESTSDSRSDRSVPRRRLTLANWIVDAQNPLTARVICNRLWQGIYGEGLVKSANDFGHSGFLPEQPELLDWLSSELQRGDWSLKRLLRLLVSGSAYRQRVPEPGSASRSARRTLRRLTAEQLRDALLDSSGLLQRRAGGPPVWPPLPPEVLQANPAFLDDNETKTKGWYPSPTNSLSVRSLYLVQKRTVKIPFLESFDLPDNSTSCPCREASLVPPQALTLLNGDLAEQSALALARRIRDQGSDSSISTDLIHRAFRYAYRRRATPEELTVCEAFLQNESLELLCRALLNSNEFVFID